MKNLALHSGIVAFGLVMFSSKALALPVSLGAAGPDNWAVLETGHHAANANVSIANASNAGYVNGNVGMGSTGNISDSGTPISGSLQAASGAGINGNVAANVAGGVFQNAASQALLNTAKADAASAAAAASALSSTAIANITAGGTLSTPGVYSLAKINLSGAVLTLSGSASDYYVFNISDSLTLSHASIVLDGGLTPDNVLYNITRVGGTGLGMSGGLSTESVLYGIVLANDSQVQETPGLVVGEIISGDNISIASGAQVSKVPDVGSTALLLSTAMACLAVVKRKLGA